ncbi:MAG: sulfate reduction electron transfer complex DsrMKJOP subunit DsrM [Terriglobales bacterium]
MKILYSLGAVIVLVLAAVLAGRFDGPRTALAILVPYGALLLFLAGICYRVMKWALSPVPFRIPTTCGQQTSLPWIKPAKLDNPFTTRGVIGRMALEILLFRSLFRNNKAEVNGQQLVFGENLLWLGAMAFHWSLLMIVVRHLRLVIEPVPAFVLWLERMDGVFQLGIPRMYVSDVVVVVSLGYLLLRRLQDPRLRYLSLFTDYFALFLLLSIAISGVLMRYFSRVDTVAIKQFTLGLAGFAPITLKPVGEVFFVHLVLVIALAAYFPLSKLMHFGGVFLSPTRNLANNNRAQRHINPWDYPVHTHSYAEWETEFRDKLAAAGLPVEADHARTASAD